MDEKQYLEERLDDQINWYDKKSMKYKKSFLFLRVIEIILASSLPFLAGFACEAVCIKYVIGLIGVSIAIIGGLITLNKFQENWILYRTTAESLRHEKYLFETKCKPYNKENAFCLLTNRVESLISKEKVS